MVKMWENEKLGEYKGRALMSHSVVGISLDKNATFDKGEILMSPWLTF